MANPTTNYGFVLPTPTDLVTDLPADFDVALQGVDTRLKALQPGTTLGDIAYSSATANTNTRLAVGSNGQYLTVTGGVPAWGGISAGGMTLISTTTLSGASTTISSIPQTYVSLYLVVAGMTANTSDSSFNLIPNNTGSTTNYVATRSYAVASIVATNANIDFSLAQNTIRTNANNACAITFNNYTSTTSYKPFNVNGFLVNGASTNAAYNINGTFMSNSALTSLVFNYGGTNTFAGGTVLLYGVK
jgi:hypothetical protein